MRANTTMTYVHVVETEPTTTGWGLTLLLFLLPMLMGVGAVLSGAGEAQASSPEALLSVDAAPDGMSRRGGTAAR